jgi:hypothetical protein
LTDHLSRQSIWAGLTPFFCIITSPPLISFLNINFWKI